MRRRLTPLFPKENQLLHKMTSRDSANVKVIICGPADSGKTTFCKQLKTHLGLKNSLISRECLLNSIKSLYLSFEKVWKDGSAPQPASTEQFLDEVQNDSVLNEKITSSHEFFYEIPGKYFYSKLKEIQVPFYQPTEKDDLLSYANETPRSFVINRENQSWTFVDCQGQGRGKKRWLLNFIDTQAVVYLVSLSSYCLELRDEENAQEVDFNQNAISNRTNRMEQALEIWEMIANHPSLVDLPAILCFTKIDEFKKKIRRFPLQHYFSDCPSNVTGLSDSVNFIVNKFLQKSTNSKKIEVAVVNLLEYSNCRFVVERCFSFFDEPKFGASKDFRILIHTGAALLFTLFVLLCDGYLLYSSYISSKQKRFFDIATYLSFDLQMVLANRCCNSMSTIIRSSEIEDSIQAWFL